jgi:hypothetical protein
MDQWQGLVNAVVSKYLFHKRRENTRKRLQARAILRRIGLWDYVSGKATKPDNSQSEEILIKKGDCTSGGNIKLQQVMGPVRSATKSGMCVLDGRR